MNPLQKQFIKILKQEGLFNWEVVKIKSGGGLCLYNHKQILLDENNYNLPFFLHELTHALLPNIKNHNSIWADKYTSLLVKYNKN